MQDPLWAERQKPPQYRYEYLERVGEVPGLPFGYSYAPAPLVEITEAMRIEAGNGREMQGTLKAVTDVQSGADGRRPDPTELRAMRRAQLQATEPISGNVVGRRGSIMALSARRPTSSGRRPTSSSRPRRPSAITQPTDTSAATEVRRSRTSLTSSSNKRRPLLKDRGEIPPGTARIPQKTDVNPFDNRRVPPGFINICPFPGYDPDRVDRAALPISAIYGKQMGMGRGPAQGVGSVVAATRARGMVDSRPGYDVPEGFTVDRHPVLWPSRIP